MLDLPDITLVCVDCATPELALRAMHRSLAAARFPRALLLTDAPLRDPLVEVRAIPRLDSLAAYSGFMLKGLAAHIATEFALVVQWDSWIIDPSCWQDTWCALDYIGAPWARRPPGQDVGNGGFSLRSRRLLCALADDAFPAGHPEDSRIGLTWRPALEAQGLRFADRPTARRFSAEMDFDPAPSFGFHGLYNFWRALPPAALDAELAALPPSLLRGWQAQDLLLRYVGFGRWPEAAIALRHLERATGTAALEQALSEFLGGGSGPAVLAAVRAKEAK